MHMEVWICLINSNLIFQQYSSGLGQYKDEFSDFGNFDPKEVQKEIKRGKKLVGDMSTSFLSGKSHQFNFRINKRFSFYKNDYYLQSVLDLLLIIL